MRRLIATIGLFLVLGSAPGVLASCGSEGGEANSGASTSAASASTVAAGQASATQALDEERTVIDVRAPDEFAAGHIDAAINLNVEDPAFDEGIAALDPEGAYVVYCRSGRRSAIAAAKMRDAGLEVLDGGAMADMVAAGWPAT